MGQVSGLGPSETLDSVISNALVVDYTGIYKADIGIKGSVIVGIGKAGNPDVMEGVSEGMVVGVCETQAQTQTQIFFIDVTVG